MKSPALTNAVVSLCNTLVHRRKFTHVVITAADTGLNNCPTTNFCSSDPNMLEPGESLLENLRRQEHDINPVSPSSILSSYWECVDVVGSPGLTRLIGALTIEACQEIPFLDLNASHSDFGESLNCDPMDLCESSDTDRIRTESKRDSTSYLVRQVLAKNDRRASVSWVSPESNRLSEISGACSISHLESTISPFPQPPGKRPASSLSSILSESECMKLLRGKTPTKIPNLMKSMWYIADTCYRTGQYSAAESWYRRIVTAKQQNLEFQPCETLSACLWVIRSMATKGEYSEALQLHEGLHAKILRLFNPAHGVCLLSRGTQSLALTNLGRTNEGQEIRREILQICLTAFGTRHPQTLIALRNLGSVLASMMRYSESEQLLRTALHIQLQEAQNFEGDITNRIEIFKTVARLTQTLNCVGRYQESRILNSAFISDDSF